MSDAPIAPVPDHPEKTDGNAAIAPLTPEYVTAKELEKLPQDMKTVVSVMVAAIRSTTGPDPEAAKIAAGAEMHSESCKLDGYKETLKNRDLQNERDHRFRIKKLNHETFRNTIFILVCVLGMCVGLYLFVVKAEKTLGSNILLASFLGLVGGGKFLSQKDKD